jgi:hypothetical protein
VTNGDPVVKNPPSAVAFMPSFTIAVTSFFSALAMLTVKCNVMLPPAGTVLPDHVTVPAEFVPPSAAETKLVLSGTGSVIVTPVAAALPMFFSVIA